MMNAAYQYPDLVPKGRDEDNLAFSMEWVRYHDRYDTGGFADADKPYWPEVASAAAAPNASTAASSSSSSCCHGSAGAQS